jgi:hypothetical protein
MSTPLGIVSNAGLQGSLAALQAIHAQLMATSAANGATAVAITPPGNEGASARAVAMQMSNAAQFSSMFALGLEQMQEEFTSMATHSAAMFAADAIGASAII